MVRNFFVLISPDDGCGNRDFFEERSKVLVDDFFKDGTVLERGIIVVGGRDLFDKGSEKRLGENFFGKTELVIDEDFYFFLFAFLTNRGRGEKDEMFNAFGVGSGEMSSDLTTERMTQKSNIFKFKFVNEGKDEVRVFFNTRIVR